MSSLVLVKPRPASCPGSVLLDPLASAAAGGVGVTAAALRSHLLGQPFS